MVAIPGTIVVEEGGTLAVVDDESVTMAAAVTPVVVYGETVVLVLPRVVVGWAAVAAVLTVVAVGFFVVAVGLAVVAVADWWHPGLPWPAGGLHVLPGWALAGPANAHAARPIATANAHVKPPPRSHELVDLLHI
jgi:hypothetical protein